MRVVVCRLTVVRRRHGRGADAGGDEEGVEPEVEQALLAHHHLGLVVDVDAHVALQRRAGGQAHARRRVAAPQLVRAQPRLERRLHLPRPRGVHLLALPRRGHSVPHRGMRLCRIQNITHCGKNLAVWQHLASCDRLSQLVSEHDGFRAIFLIRQTDV